MFFFYPSLGGGYGLAPAKRAASAPECPVEPPPGSLMTNRWANKGIYEGSIIMWASSMHACMEKGFLIRSGACQNWLSTRRDDILICTMSTSIEAYSATSTHMAGDRTKDILCLKSSRRMTVCRRMQNLTCDPSLTNR